MYSGSIGTMSNETRFGREEIVRTMVPFPWCLLVWCFGECNIVDRNEKIIFTKNTYLLVARQWKLDYLIERCSGLERKECSNDCLVSLVFTDLYFGET